MLPMCAGQIIDVLFCNARHSKYIHVDSSDASVSSSSNFTVNISHDDYVMLPILPVTINNTFHTYALLDTGSSNSFCSRRLIDRLNINGPVTTYELNTIGKTVYQRSEMVNFKMSTISTSIDMKNIRVVNYIVWAIACPPGLTPLDTNLHRILINLIKINS